MSSFLSQVVSFADTYLERDYLYGRALGVVLPGNATGRIELGSEVELTHLRVEQSFAGAPIIDLVAPVPDHPNCLRAKSGTLTSLTIAQHLLLGHVRHSGTVAAGAPHSIDAADRRHRFDAAPRRSRKSAPIRNIELRARQIAGVMREWHRLVQHWAAQAAISHASQGSRVLRVCVAPPTPPWPRGSASTLNAAL